MWKKKTESEPVEQKRWDKRMDDIPSGVCVDAPSGYYYIKQNKRFRIPTERVFFTWNFPTVIRVEEVAIKHMPIVGKLGLRDGSFVQDYSTNRKYIVAAGELRELKSPESQDRLQLKDPYIVGERDLEFNKKGADIT